MNAIADRWVRSIKTEYMNRIIPFGFTSLERSVNEFVAHYNLERPHQETGNELIAGSKDSGTGEVIVSERLGGLQKHYHRAAAGDETTGDGKKTGLRSNLGPAISFLRREQRRQRAEHTADGLYSILNLYPPRRFDRFSMISRRCKPDSGTSIVIRWLLLRWT